MAIKKAAFFKCIKEFKLKELFNELGWDNTNVKHPVKIDDQFYILTALAQKKDFLIFLCSPDSNGTIPDSAARKKIDNTITKLHYEHLIIYVDGKKTRQRWELMIREQNRPVVCRPIDYFAGQEPELLFQKLEGLFFTFEDEDKLSIVDVRSRVIENFEKNAEVVTKKFYERFQKEHQKFLSFIEGIESKVDTEWYASLMLNRLMFIYFIQKKGFLDRDRNYLRNRLDAIQQRKGRNKFYSFYRNFLLVLFHKGLGSPLRNPELEADVGKVPYLNGGLFDIHEIERDNKGISIQDKAFELIFDFFDEYNWHLDARITASGKDINPDVIGYIFEKYINDRAAMGAYYTKEDITGYISKNCIVPWLFDELRRNYANGFKKDTEIWTLLKKSGDRYIYPAAKHGVDQPLPEDIEAGIKDVFKRNNWNQEAPSIYALPTEIWREVAARRQRYMEVLGRIPAGEITEIDDFITYNLDMCQFVQDVVRETDDPDLIEQLYKAVTKITVLDPACGSGAFLFAALNVLEPIYFACVTRMREFVEESGKGKRKFFEDELAKIDAPEHPSTEYFIYKSIILHNLYGVDIMKEAVEIAKLRLFLKLVATVDVDYRKSNLGLEPLPDIDFNIRSGNTLIGYATLADLDKERQRSLFGDKEKKAILDEAEVVTQAYARFKDAQLVMYSDPNKYKGAKEALINRLRVLNDKLNKYLAVTYLEPTHDKKSYETWLSTHQPFHWLAEYYTIMAQGGFDIIIGNPPFLETKDIRYEIKGLTTCETSAVHAMCVERSLQLASKASSISMVFPMSLVSTQRMKCVQSLLEKGHSCWYADFAWRPGKLFDTVNRAISVFTRRPTEKESTWSTAYSKWTSDNRIHLIPTLGYVKVPVNRVSFWVPKFSSNIESVILGKLLHFETTLSRFMAKTRFRVYYRTTGGLYWKVFTDFPPSFKVNGKKGHSSRETWFSVSEEKYVKSVIACLSSDVFWWWYTITSNLRDLNPSDLRTFPVAPSALEDEDLNDAGVRYLNDIVAKSTLLVREQKQTGRTETQSFKIQSSKPIIDEIDRVLAQHYGFTEEELDFIINYDIKYRIGKELDAEE